MGPRFQYRGFADPVADGQGQQPLRQTLSGTSRLNQRPYPLRLIRLSGLILLVVIGLLVALFFFPLCADRLRVRLKAIWSACLVRILGIRIDARITQAQAGSLLVANHISWVDIFVVNAFLPAAFIAKEEVRHWPLAGWLAARNDTVFLRRGSRGHARIINQEIANLLDQGKYVAVFPEGTTTDGTHIQHFHAALIQPALAAARPVIPLALSYWDADAQRALAPRYDGAISLGECTRAILAQRGLVARLEALPAQGLNGEDRRQVAVNARRLIAEAAGLPLPDDEKPAQALSGTDSPGAQAT